MVDVITFFLISDVANGFDGVAPYAMFQAGHFVLGLLASRCRPNTARALLVLWVLKEVIFDNLVFGGSLLVAIDSVADLAFGRRGYAVALRITVPVYSVVRAQAALQPFPDCRPLVLRAGVTAHALDFLKGTAQVFRAERWPVGHDGCSGIVHDVSQ